MKDDTLTLARNEPQLAAAAIVALVGLATIGGFFFFQYVVGLAPCPLCLEQRNAYYISVPLAALLWLGAGYGSQRKVLLIGFLVIAAAMLWNTGLVHLSRRHRMEVVAGPAGMHRADEQCQHGQGPAQSAQHVQPRAL